MMMKTVQQDKWLSLPGADDVHRVQLSNGITILTRTNFNSPSVVIHGYLGAGSVFDTDDKLGLAYFTAQSLLRGTTRRNTTEIYNLLETAGASLGIGASVHNVTFGGRCLSEDLSILMMLLSESLQEPVFPQDQVEKLRARILTGIAMREDDTADTASLAFDSLLFPGHPYGKPDDGFSETVMNIKQEDLVEFHRQHYGPAGMVIVVVGAVQPQTVIQLVKQTFAGWYNSGQLTPPVLKEIGMPCQTIRKHITLPGKSQTDIVMGTLGPHRLSEDYLPASLGNNILGRFGMMGRIGDVVREQSGLAYHASTSLNAWIASGSWEVSAGVNPANLNKAIELIINELDRFVTEPVTEAELQDSKSNYIGRLPLSMESNAGVASALAGVERFQLGLNYYREYPQKIQAITSEQILQSTQKYLDPQKLVIVSAGSELM